MADSAIAPAVEAAIDVVGLDRNFGRRQALIGVDLRVLPSEIVGLVGPNGSGKTSLLKILGGFLKPHGGRVQVFGLEPFAKPHHVMRRARFAFAPPALYDALTPMEHLHHLSRIGGYRPSKDELTRALATVGLADRAHDRVATLSFGMRQRLVVALALVPMPELLVLDEPTDGLDPVAVLELRDVLLRLRNENGLAVLLSSHLLVEIEHLVDHMLVLNEGRTLFSGRPDEMIQTTLRLETSSPEAAKAALTQGDVQVRSGQTNGHPWLELDTGTFDLEQCRALLHTHGIELQSFYEYRPTLEEALLQRLRAERGVLR